MKKDWKSKCKKCDFNEQIKRKSKLITIFMCIVFLGWISFFVCYFYNVSLIPSFVMVAIGYGFAVFLQVSKMITEKKIKNCQGNTIDIIIRIREKQLHEDDEQERAKIKEKLKKKIKKQQNDGEKTWKKKNIRP